VAAAVGRSLDTSEHYSHLVFSRQAAKGIKMTGLDLNGLGHVMGMDFLLDL